MPYPFVHNTARIRETLINQCRRKNSLYMQYISGANAPANSQPTLVQYGVTSAGATDPVIRLKASRKEILPTFSVPFRLLTPVLVRNRTGFSLCEICSRDRTVNTIQRKEQL